MKNENKLQLLESFSGNKLIAIVGPELALWCAGDCCSTDNICGCGRTGGVVVCVECLTGVILIAGDDGLEIPDDCVEFNGIPLVGLWYEEERVVGAEDGDRLVWVLPLL